MSPRDEASKLLILPLELRDRVYEFALPSVLDGRCTHSPCSVKLKCDCPRDLLRVCKQIRRETLPLYYSTHMVWINLWRSDQVAIASWLGRMEEVAIQHIRIFGIESFSPSAHINSSHVIVVVHIGTTEMANGVHGRRGQDRYEKCNELGQIVQTLPHVNGKSVFTKEALRRLLEIIGMDLSVNRFPRIDESRTLEAERDNRSAES